MLSRRSGRSRKRKGKGKRKRSKSRSRLKVNGKGKLKLVRWFVMDNQQVTNCNNLAFTTAILRVRQNRKCKSRGGYRCRRDSRTKR